MEIITFTEEHMPQILSRAERILRSGGVVAGPTDTVYGFFADALNAAAVKKIFSIKKRMKASALPVFVKDIPMARRYAYVSDAKAKFLETVWPGAVTVVFAHKEKFPKTLTGKKETIALRMPAHSLLQQLLAVCDAPIAQTSANMSGEVPVCSGQELYSRFTDSKVRPDLVIDAGELLGVPSTIIDFSNNQATLVRMGMRDKSEFDELFESILI